MRREEKRKKKKNKRQRKKEKLLKSEKLGGMDQNRVEHVGSANQHVAIGEHSRVHGECISHAADSPATTSF